MWMTNRRQFLLSTGAAAFWVQFHGYTHAGAGGDDGALRIHVRMAQETGVIYGLRTLRARMPLTSHNQG